MPAKELRCEEEMPVVEASRHSTLTQITLQLETSGKHLKLVL